MPAILCSQKIAFIKKTSLFSKCRNCLSGLVKIQQRIHKEILCFIIVRKKCDIWKMWLFFTTKRKNLYRCGKNYWPAVAFTFCATFKRAINRPKSDPRLFFLSNFFINGQAYNISGKKIQIFRYCARECQGKDVQIIINNTLLICDNNYETMYNCPTSYEKNSFTIPLMK